MRLKDTEKIRVFGWSYPVRKDYRQVSRNTFLPVQVSRLPESFFPRTSLFGKGFLSVVSRLQGLQKRYEKKPLKRYEKKFCNPIPRKATYPEGVRILPLTLYPEGVRERLFFGKRKDTYPFGGVSLRGTSG